MEITMALIMRQIVITILVCLGVAVAYSALALAITAFLRSIWAFGDDPYEDK